MQSGGSAEITRYMQEQKINFSVVNDTDGMLSRTWGVRGVPTSFIIALDGQIRFVEVGYTTGIIPIFVKNSINLAFSCNLKKLRPSV